MAAAPLAASVSRVFHTVASQRAVSEGLAALRAGGGSRFRVPPDGELPVTPDEMITTVVDVAAHLPAKLAALRAHATQLSAPADDHFALTNDIAQPITPHEYFVLAHGTAEGAGTDLFGGL
jgi:N-acetyl-1-D-myo-inositol-2-amino-2-deoxy-alpha-D-glucopyranoside deacetylase